MRLGEGGRAVDSQARGGSRQVKIPLVDEDTPGLHLCGPGGCEWNVGTDGHHLTLAQGEGEAPGLDAPTGGAPAPGRGVRRECSECFQQATLRANAQKIKAVEAIRRVLASSWEVVSSQNPKRHFRAQNLSEELSGQRNSLDPRGP